MDYVAVLSAAARVVQLASNITQLDERLQRVGSRRTETKELVGIAQNLKSIRAIAHCTIEFDERGDAAQAALAANQCPARENLIRLLNAAVLVARTQVIACQKLWNTLQAEPIRPSDDEGRVGCFNVPLTGFQHEGGIARPQVLEATNLERKSYDQARTRWVSTVWKELCDLRKKKLLAEAVIDVSKQRDGIDGTLLAAINEHRSPLRSQGRSLLPIVRITSINRSPDAGCLTLGAILVDVEQKAATITAQHTFERDSVGTESGYLITYSDSKAGTSGPWLSKESAAVSDAYGASKRQDLRSAGTSYGDSNISGQAHLGDNVHHGPVNIQQLVLLNSRNDATPVSEDGSPYMDQLQLPVASLLSSAWPTASLQTSPVQDIRIRRPLDVVRQIQKSLYFEEESFRFSDIKEAHHLTFRWIVQPPTHSRMNAFWNWLSSSNSCFWIQGKAGSGKSTLMKYILTKMSELSPLRQWAGIRHLLKLSFFFWHAGNSLQKTYEGVLRSFLHQVLDRRPDLAQAVFPKLYMQLLDARDESLQTFTLLDTRLVQKRSHPHIDLEQARTNMLSNVSVMPGFRLQDLTSGDIVRYIDEELTRDSILKDLDKVDRGLSNDVVQALTEKASGVFLWIVLVVREIRVALARYPTRRTLFKLIDALPNELEKLYQHMFGRMNPQDQQSGSRLLQYVYHASTTQVHSLDALQLFFAVEEENEWNPPSTEMVPWTPEDEAIRIKVLEGRLRSHCCGFVEIQLKRQSSNTPVVDFIHRTVLEYLSQYSVWDRLRLLHPVQTMFMHKVMLHACARALFWGAFDSPGYNITRRDAKLVQNSLSYAKHLNNDDDRSHVHVLHAVDQHFLRSCREARLPDDLRRYRIYNSVYDNFSFELDSISLKTPGDNNSKMTLTNSDLRNDEPDVALFCMLYGGMIELFRMSLALVQSGCIYDRLLYRLISLFAREDHLAQENEDIWLIGLDLLLQKGDPNFDMNPLSSLPMGSLSDRQRTVSMTNSTPWVVWLFYLHATSQLTKDLEKPGYVRWRITLMLVQAGALLSGLFGDAMEYLNEMVDDLAYWRLRPTKLPSRVDAILSDLDKELRKRNHGPRVDAILSDLDKELSKYRPGKSLKVTCQPRKSLASRISNLFGRRSLSHPLHDSPSTK